MCTELPYPSIYFTPPTQASSLLSIITWIMIIICLWHLENFSVMNGAVISRCDIQLKMVR